MAPIVMVLIGALVGDNLRNSRVAVMMAKQLAHLVLMDAIAEPGSARSQKIVAPIVMVLIGAIRDSCVAVMMAKQLAHLVLMDAIAEPENVIRNQQKKHVDV